MSDFLLELGKNSQARKMIKSLGLPIPIPQSLKRAKGAWETRILARQDVAVYVTPKSYTTGAIAHTLAEAGATSYVAGDASAIKHFKGPGEAFGQPAQKLDLEKELSDDATFAALVIDATGISTTSGLRALYDFYHPLVRKLGKCGRAVVIGSPPDEQSSAEAAAAQAALSGFTRSLAKEVGKTGSSALLLYVSKGAEERLAGALRFALSSRSVYVSGQPLTITSTAAAPNRAPAWVGALDGKVALVTGAARGIGAATARILAAEGATVVILDRPEDDAPASQLAREINGDMLLVDVTEEGAPQKIAKHLKTKHGGVDIVVHNAGITRDKTIANMKPLFWDQTIDVNLTAVVNITSELLKGTLREHGRIICLSSIAGIAGNMGQTNYAASKSGIVGYVNALGKELADRGITANAIAPGFIETRLTAAIPVAIREVGRRMNNLGQGGLPEDVGQAISFLASPGSLGVTGQVLRVCGGAILGA